MKLVYKLSKNPSGVAGMILLGIVVAAFIMSFIWTPYSVSAINPYDPWAPVSTDHVFGTDKLGRDIFSLVILGSRITLLTCLGSAVIAFILGLALAALIGFGPRPVSALTERMVDVLIAFPTLIVALILVTAFQGSMLAATCAIGIGSATAVTRTILPELRRAIASDYVLLATSSGAGPWWLFTRHIIPSVTATLIVRMTQIMGIAALAEAGLSFLGLGTPPPTPSWGRMLATYQDQIYTRPEVLAFPAFAIIIVILGFNLLGDGLRDVIDPRRVRRSC